MSLLPALLLALGLQVALAVGAILLGELAIEERRARALEWLASLAILAGLLLLTLGGSTRPPLAVAVAAAFSLVQFALGRGVAHLGGAVADLGTDYGGLGTRYPLTASIVAVVLFVPAGLGRSLGLPDLFEGLEIFYAGALVAHLLVLLLQQVLSGHRGSHAFLWIGTLSIVIGFQSLSTGVTTGGRAAILTFLLAGILTLLEVGLAVLLGRVIGPDEEPAEAMRDRSRLLLVAWGLALIVWIATQGTPTTRPY